MNLLLSLTAGLVGCFYINRLYKLSESVRERLTTNIPYGYKASPDNPKEWAVDEEAAKIVKRIFTLCMEGKGPSQIATRKRKGAEPHRLQTA